MIKYLLNLYAFKQRSKTWESVRWISKMTPTKLSIFFSSFSILATAFDVNVGKMAAVRLLHEWHVRNVKHHAISEKRSKWPTRAVLHTKTVAYPPQKTWPFLPFHSSTATKSSCGGFNGRWVTPHPPQWPHRGGVQCSHLQTETLLV